MYYLHLAPCKGNLHHDNRACFTFMGKYRTKDLALKEAKRLGFTDLRLCEIVDGVFTGHVKLD